MANNSLQGQFVPTTNVWDTQPIMDLDIDPAFRELLVRLYQNLNVMAQAVNDKPNGFFDNTREMIINSALFPTPGAVAGSLNKPRPIYRTVLNSGALPNAGTLTVAHNISPNSSFTVTRIWAAATLPSDVAATLRWIPIPYVDANTPANNIQLYADGMNAYIVTTIDYTAYTRSQIYIEYIKY